jgi:hypothetical protein
MATIHKRMQFQDLYSDIFVYTATYDPGNAATGSGTFASSDVTVPGVALGDAVLSVSFSLDTVDAVLAAAVTAANTVTVTVLNNTAGAVNLASGTIRLVIAKHNSQISFV